MVSLNISAPTLNLEPTTSTADTPDVDPPPVGSVALHISPDLDKTTLSEIQWWRLICLTRRTLQVEVPSSVPLRGGTWAVGLTGMRESPEDWDIYSGYIQCPLTHKKAPVQVKLHCYEPVGCYYGYLGDVPYYWSQSDLDNSKRPAYREARIFTGPLRDLQGSMVPRFYGLYLTNVEDCPTHVMIQELAGTPLVKREGTYRDATLPSEISRTTQDTFDNLIQIIKTIHERKVLLGMVGLGNLHKRVERRVAPKKLVQSKGVPAGMHPAPGSGYTLCISNFIFGEEGASPSSILHEELEASQDAAKVVDPQWEDAEHPGTVKYLLASLPRNCDCSMCTAPRWYSLQECFMKRSKGSRGHARAEDFKYGSASGSIPGEGDGEKSPEVQVRKETQKNIELAKRQRRVQRNRERREKIMLLEKAALELKMRAEEEEYEEYERMEREEEEKEQRRRDREVEFQESQVRKKIEHKQRAEEKRIQRTQWAVKAEQRAREISGCRAAK